MKLNRIPLMALAIAPLASSLIGCTGDTSVSVQPSEKEIQDGIQRRIDQVDKNPGLSAEAKERMKSQIRGNRGPASSRN